MAASIRNQAPFSDVYNMGKYARNWVVMMKRSLIRTIRAIAMLMLMAAFIPALAESWWADTDMGHRYHALEDCALAKNVEREADSFATFAADAGFYPCPVCVPDEAEYPGVEAWTRGGTVVVRVPEDYMAEKLAGETEPGEIPEELLRDGGAQDGDLARLLHGEAYQSALNGEGGWWSAVTAQTALIPEYAGDALLMSQRHLGAAWYIVIRPDEKGRKALAKSGEMPLKMRYWRATLAVRRYDAGAAFEVADAAFAEEEITLKPVKSSGEEAWRMDAEDVGDVGLYVLRDGDVNTLVLREMGGAADGPSCRASYKGAEFELNGYADGKDAVYCCAVSDDELDALRERLFFDLYAAPLWRQDGGEAATEAQSSPDYIPISSAVMADGTAAELTAAEYPLGVAAIGCKLTRPGGGIAYYSNVARLQYLSDGSWYPLGDVDIQGYVNGDEERIHGGWFCDEAALVWSLKPFGVLPEGLYRLRVGDVEMNDGTAWLEFRVREGATDPGLPGVPAHAAPDFDLPTESDPPHADVENYNSCADTTRVSGDAERLLAGGVVYELRGVDESWGWGIVTHFDLFAYPEGQPERAALLLEDFDHPDVTLYDAGDGLLLVDEDYNIWHCGYDDGGLRSLGRPFEEHTRLYYGGEPADGEATDEYLVRAALPVGDGLYLATDGGVWHTGLNPIAPELVYKAEKGMQNGDRGGGCLVYAEGRLFVADGGIVAIDTTQRDADGMMPAARLTDAYDFRDGESGFGYIVLNGRLYCWDGDKKATVAIPVEGGEAEVVSKEHFWFHAVSPSGVALALTGTAQGMFGDERTGAAFYFPADPANPAFDPDHCEKRAIAPDDFDFILGDTLYHIDGDGNETREPL